MPHPVMAELLRFTTAGSVDDGKSTLIGRLLHDTRSIAEDQLAAVEEASRRRGEDGVNLALLTDGLRAEREQNITIDVAYRYFATSRRAFIIADTPGHVQYTRNMVTGASTAELAVILVDARKGVLTQSRRHGFLASLLGIPHVVVAVNKMDLVGWSQEVFDGIVREYRDFARKLGVDDLSFIPVSALLGDNVVEPSANMPWYGGGTLLHHLEQVHVGGYRNQVDFRLPVQIVLRADGDYRGYAGQVASGAIRPGEEVLVLPSGQRSRVASVTIGGREAERPGAGDSVAVTLDDAVDVARGDMLVRPLNLPVVGQDVDATLCWMAQSELRPGEAYWLRHTTREVKAFVTRVVYRMDMDTLHRQEAETLGLNDIGRVQITTAQPLFFDPYRLNRETGSFILVDPHSHDTVAAGMIRGPVQRPEEVVAASSASAPVSPDVVWEDWNVPLTEREDRNGHKGVVVWLTGLPASGKSAVARAVEGRLFAAGCQTMLLDGDQLRHGLNGDLAFSSAHRKENIRRAGEVASLFLRQGCVTLCSFVSPFLEDRERVRALMPPGRFVEVFVDTPLEVCEARDPKGLYARARRGEVPDMTGVSSPYEAPEEPEVHLVTAGLDPQALAERVVAELVRRGLVPQGVFDQPA